METKTTMELIEYNRRQHYYLHVGSW